MKNMIHTPAPSFPTTRLRRLRSHGWLREMVQEFRLHPADFILPLFVQEGANLRTPIPSLPGVERLSIDALVSRASDAADLGIPAIAIFPAIDAALKTPRGEEALNAENLVCRAIRAVKAAVPNLGIIADVALDPYTTHGQDGIFENGIILNDATIEILVEQALTLARAGADILAPSDMMDGRIGAIRARLEAESFTDVALLSYAAKYASHFYGPFRDAVGSSAALGAADKRTYQMNFANGAEALREVAMDIAEGADMVMVKPAGAYLDIIYRVSNAFPLPVFAYQVSGEYAMLKAAAANGWLKEGPALMESLIAIKRAGARAILTYGAIDAARMLEE